MNVVFKLNAEQLVRAKAIVAALTSSAEEPDQEQVWCGNLLGYQGHSFSFNSNQHLELNEDSSTIEYKGERNPLQQDGGLDVLYTVATGKTPDLWMPVEQRAKWWAARVAVVQQLRVVLYKTTDSRLEWWETLEDLVLRLTPGEFLEETKKYKGKILPLAFLWAARIIVEKYNQVEFGTPAYRRMVAEGDEVNWRIARTIRETF